MREFPLGRLRYLYHCHICNHVTINRLPFFTAVRGASSQLLRYGARTGKRWTTSRGYHSLGYQLERFKLNPDKFFKGGVTSSSLRFLTSWHLLKSLPAGKLTLAGGGLLFGGLGLLFVNRYPTAYCRNETESGCRLQTPNSDSVVLSLAQTPISELSLLQQLKLVIRFLCLSILFSPAALLYGVSYLTGSSDLANLAWRYSFFAIQMAGPAFVKLGQWASTRRDIFSEDFCRAMSKLHTRCNPHSWRDTDRAMCENFGEDWEENVIILDHTVIGSGCVAQVYQGYLKTRDHNKGSKDNVLDKLVAGEVDSTELKEAALTADHGYIPIAVKVLHPRIVEAMDQDIRLMKYVASWVDRLFPDVHWIALKECVDEFSAILQQQVGGAC